MLLGMAPVSTAWGAAEEPEIVAGGYEIDMDDLPKVYFSEHPEWQALYEEAWHTHKNNIKKASTSINPNDVILWTKRLMRRSMPGIPCL